MGLQKGKTNNPNGRPRGVPNKITKEVKNALARTLKKNLKRFDRDMMLLEPYERIQATLKIAEFIIPKRASMEVGIDLMTIEDKQEILIQILEAYEQKQIQLTEDGQGTYSAAERLNEG